MESYEAFLEEHCKIRHYIFSVKKCTQDKCICKPPRLPKERFDTLEHLPDPVPDKDDEHYMAFDELYGKFETTEEHRPSEKQE